jgi:hypothetical protein
MKSEILFLLALCVSIALVSAGGIPQQSQQKQSKTNSKENTQSKESNEHHKVKTVSKTQSTEESNEKKTLRSNERSQEVNEEQKSLLESEASKEKSLESEVRSIEKISSETISDSLDETFEREASIALSIESAERKLLETSHEARERERIEAHTEVELARALQCLVKIQRGAGRATFRQKREMKQFFRQMLRCEYPELPDCIKDGFGGRDVLCLNEVRENHHTNIQFATYVRAVGNAFNNVY